MAKTARATIVPFWYNMNGTTEELREAEEKLGKAPGTFGEPDEDETPFEVQLKPLNGMDQLSLKDHMFVNKVTNDVEYTAEGMFKAVRMGLVDWRNINDNDGTPLKFSIATALDVLEHHELKLIAYKIMANSVVSDALRKK